MPGRRIPEGPRGGPDGPAGRVDARPDAGILDAMTSPLVSAEVLGAWIDSGRTDLRVVDVRWYLGQPAGSGRIAYEAGHVPGAIHLDVDADLVAPDGPGRHPLPDPQAFARTLADRGIGDGTTVVAYDDVGGWVAARLWWMLEDLGFGVGQAAAAEAGGALVLDGGLQAWIAVGRALSTDRPTFPPARLHLAGRWNRVIGREALRAELGSVLLLDARGGARYRGEVEPIDRVPGHIPTALNAPVDGSLGSDGRFLGAAELRTTFEGLRAAAVAAGQATNADPSGAVVASCGSGVSACHTALAMRIAGLPNPVLYPGSYSDWSRAGEPVVTGAEPGWLAGAHGPRADLAG